MKIIFVLSALMVLTISLDSCRFAKQFTQQELKTNSTKQEEFLQNVLKWESKFVKDIGVDKISGLTLDGQQLDVETGLPYGKPHEFTASSKESIHLAILAQALANNKYASMIYSIEEAFELLEKKIQTYEKFDQDYPGYGGFLPWVSVVDGVVTPAWDWQDGVPGLDNGQLFWAVYGVVSVLETWHTEQEQLIQRFTKYYQKMAKNSIVMFYEGEGKIRSVTKILDIKLSVEQNTYTNRMTDCTNFNNPCYLDDPYEGELFAWMMYLMAPWSDEKERELIWINKRPKLESVSYYVTELKQSITVQRGWWFSAHEQWKYLFMPYEYDSLNNQLMLNAEKVRTWDAKQNKRQGMFASVTGNLTINENPQYFSDCGIQDVSYQKVTHDYLVTPYSTMTLFLANRQSAILWYHNMISGPAGQNQYGSTEGVTTTGDSVSPFITWDSKITTVLGIIGGIQEYTAKKMVSDQYLNQFLKILNTEWSRVFTSMQGNNVGFAFPEIQIPNKRKDFTTCQGNNDEVNI